RCAGASRIADRGFRGRPRAASRFPKSKTPATLGGAGASGVGRRGGLLLPAGLLGLGGFVFLALGPFGLLERGRSDDRGDREVTIGDRAFGAFRQRDVADVD